MGEIETTDNGVIYNGRKLTVSPGRRNKVILDVDGKKIKVDGERFLLMYVFFSLLYGSNVKTMEEEEDT